MNSSDILSTLLQLSHDVGREDRPLAILGEGNTSARLDDETFAVKASGSTLGKLKESDLAVCRFDKILPLIDEKSMKDEDIDNALLAARVSEDHKKPSTEAMFHAWLLSLEGVSFVGHCHSEPVNQILCSPRARDFAEHRMFPDEIVCCGRSSVFVPYVDPGLALSKEIRERTKAYINQVGELPRLILLQNHGLIAIGKTPQAVMACLLMATKAATIFVGAAAMGGPNFMLPQHVERIAGRPDEAYRQRALNI